MASIVTCNLCNAKLKVAADKLGKKFRCPRCKEVFVATDSQVQSTATTANQSDCWYLQSHTGDQFGPVPKQQLDQWFYEGLITTECRVFREGDDDWQLASELYSHLIDGEENHHDVIDQQDRGSNIWNAIDCVNLFHTGIGLCDWQIHLCKEGIVCLPEGLTHAINAGVAGGVASQGGVVMDPLGAALSRGGPQQIVDSDDEKWMRFPISNIKAVVVQKKLLGSRLFIELKDGTVQKFSTDNAAATHQARYVMRKVYKPFYREEKFKKPASRKKALR